MKSKKEVFLMQNQISKELITERAFQLGANLCGIGDLTIAHDFIQENYGDYCADFPRAVSIAIFFPREIVQEQLGGPTRSYDYFYDTINRQLDTISLTISNMLQIAGYRTYPIPASDYRQNARGENLQKLIIENGIESMPKIGTEYIGMFSHRLAASQAGLGWIGKSCSLINPTVGPRLRLATVLTNASLKPDEPMPNRCGECNRCHDICPAKAILGRTFDSKDPLTARLEREKCICMLDSTRQIFGQGTCGLCLAACPWGASQNVY